MQIHTLVRKSLTAGSIAALAMMPFGLAFRAADMRVGHYGPKFAELYLSNPGPMLLFAQHMVLGWISAAPLVATLTGPLSLTRSVLIGAWYGIAYYVLINSITLPLYFGDELPWLLGLVTVVPSLVIHIVFGITVACAARHRPTAYSTPS